MLVTTAHPTSRRVLYSGHRFLRRILPQMCAGNPAKSRPLRSDVIAHASLSCMLLPTKIANNSTFRFSTLSNLLGRGRTVADVVLRGRAFVSHALDGSERRKGGHPPTQMTFTRVNSTLDLYG